MTDTTQTVPTVQSNNQPLSQANDDDAIDAFMREFGQEAGKRIGTALAEGIRDDPEARRAAATGAGIGVGVVTGIAVLAFLTQ